MGGGGSTTVTPAAPTADEAALTALNLELGQLQLQSYEMMLPYQQQLLDLSLSQLTQNQAYLDAYNAAITPEEQAAAAAAEFERQQALGPIQDEILQIQLDLLRSGGAATPEQLALINAATEAGITAGTADIEAATGRGIGLIADELANSRGLRLSDSPLSSEAALLAQEGLVQQGSLIKNMQAAGAAAALNYPLAVNQLQGGFNLSQQNILQSAQQFQGQLRQQAYQNRLALTGAATSGGIGLASIGPRPASSSGGYTSTTDSSGGFSLGGIGQAASGAAAIAPFLGFSAASDRRLKKDYGVVAETKGGLKLHLFRYKGEDKNDPLRLGVMADEIEKVIPSAVKTHRSGYKVVDYSQVR